ncbi:Bacterial Ig-like domain protein [Candidatus Regiella insecticola 5.15]|uniref:Bacterial Ig-like domain protein n=1 Tax=Candidatus Regiella insecticola 5.15 TaxID=1005043 RepID=G2GY58_9ENTR|nr:Ig-like domain-containing protein [Candidatus Regiella insecticola]EGY29335.1 Bacterial Ig-like domain protein [Candidatus Regiella insecticola 5.15]
MNPHGTRNKNKSLTSIGYWLWLYLLTLLVCSPAAAIFTGKTGVIHGRPPMANGVLHVLAPDGTKLQDNAILSLSDSPAQFTLSNITRDISVSDKDGDAGLSSRIEDRRSTFIWQSEGKDLSEDEKSRSFNAMQAEGKKYTLIVETAVSASSSSGIPRNKWHRLSRTYQLRVTKTFITPKNMSITGSKVNANGSITHSIKIIVTDEKGKPVADQDVRIRTTNRAALDPHGAIPRINGQLSPLIVQNMKTNKQGIITISVTNTETDHSSVFAQLNNRSEQEKKLSFP